jgi:hypothetical protein
MYSDSHQLAPEASRPPVATSPRAHEPLIRHPRYREALRASAQGPNLYAAPTSTILYSLLALTALIEPRTWPPFPPGVTWKLEHNTESQVVGLAASPSCRDVGKLTRPTWMTRP